MTFPVRISHVLGDSGVAAIVRDGEILYVVKDITHWTDRNGKLLGRELTRVTQVRNMLGIDKVLREPPRPRDKQEKDAPGYTIPITPFPLWCVCSECKTLQRWRYWERPRGTTISHPSCRSEACAARKRSGKRPNVPRLQQVRWVLAHEDGRLAEVPWHYLAHQGATRPEQKACKAQHERDYLSLINARDVRGYVLRCNLCHASNSFKGNERQPFNDISQPWLRFPPFHKSVNGVAAKPAQPTSQDDQSGFILEVNDARLYSSEQRSAIVIPPESRLSHTSLSERLQQQGELLDQIARARSPLRRRQAVHELASRLRCEPTDIENTLLKLEDASPAVPANITPEHLLRLEYEAITTPIPDLLPDEDFVTEHLTAAWLDFRSMLPDESRLKQIAQVVDKVIAIKRLKRVNVQIGFSRLHGALVSPAIGETPEFLPAVEFYGEGIFIALDEAILEKWERLPEVVAYEQTLTRRVQGADLKFGGLAPPQPLARFVLLHTLSHLLIRELESESGYTAAALQERVYCSSAHSGNGQVVDGNLIDMSGIVISATVADVNGTLGGLVELAAPDRLMRLLERAFSKVSWCSLDPVCSAHDGQGLHLLNRAACHGCCMVPEPACGFSNVLLDRLLLERPAHFGGASSNRPPGLLDMVNIDA